MDLDKYYNELDKIAQVILEKQVSAHDYLEEQINQDSKQIKNLVDFRKTLLDSKEKDKALAYFSIGLFNNYSGIERIACFIITFEIDELRIKKDWSKRCVPYSSSLPLFTKAPSLLECIRVKPNGNKDNELLDFSKLIQIDDSEILKYDTIFTKLDFALNPTILFWVKETFKNKQIFVRANPFDVFDSKPPRYLCESILMPANPNWWKNLQIYNRTKQGAAYILDDCSPKTNATQFWEYHVKNMRSLQVISKRNNNGNMSMMIEELTSIDTNQIMRGRMIHLDTDDEYGTSFDESTLNHLDLAINIYEGEDAAIRQDQNLAEGEKVQDATNRMHLLRIEKIPFKALFGFVVSYFRSQTLITEWFEDQFK